MKTFRVWVRQFIEEDTPFGDLARDITDDFEFPKKNNHDTIAEYLRFRNASLACLLTFKRAWKEYDRLQ